MRRLYFAPASNRNPIAIPKPLKRTVNEQWTPFDPSLEEWSPYENLRATVLSPICATDLFGLPVRYDLVPIWGLTPTSVANYWSQIQPGDFLIFYTGSGNFPYIAEIGMKTTDEKMAAALWPYYELGEKRGGGAKGTIQSQILYLDTVWNAELSQNTIEYLRHSQDTHIRGFSRVPKNRISRLEKSADEIVANATGTIRSVAIRRDPIMKREVSRALRKGVSDSKLLRIIYRETEIDRHRLSDAARDALMDCVKSIYPE